MFENYWKSNRNTNVVNKNICKDTLIFSAQFNKSKFFSIKLFLMQLKINTYINNINSKKSSC